MDSKVSVHVHHHGDFTPHPNVKYVGAEVDVIEDFDTDLLCFRDMEEFAANLIWNKNKKLDKNKQNNMKTIKADITLGVEHV